MTVSLLLLLEMVQALTEALRLPRTHFWFEKFLSKRATAQIRQTSITSSIRNPRYLFRWMPLKSQRRKASVAFGTTTLRLWWYLRREVTTSIQVALAQGAPMLRRWSTWLTIWLMPLQTVEWTCTTGSNSSSRSSILAALPRVLSRKRWDHSAFSSMILVICTRANYSTVRDPDKVRWHIATETNTLACGSLIKCVTQKESTLSVTEMNIEARSELALSSQVSMEFLRVKELLRLRDWEHSMVAFWTAKFMAQESSNRLTVMA